MRAIGIVLAGGDVYKRQEKADIEAVFVNEAL